MLKDRVTVNENGFSLYKDKDNPNRQAYYTTFKLADDEINKTQGMMVTYWDPMHNGLHNVQANTYVCIWEVEENNVVEECQIYIRICWPGNQSEKINSQHIWLENQKSGRRYSFLTDYIEPRTRNGEDCYIIEILPGRANVSDLVIRGDDTLLQKYEIVG